MGSGAILTEVIQAAELLAARGITAHVISVTSWSELARNGAACHTGNGLNSPSSLSTPWVAQVLRQTQGPIIAATDYVRAAPCRTAFAPTCPQAEAAPPKAPTAFAAATLKPRCGLFFGVDAARIAAAALRLLTA